MIARTENQFGRLKNIPDCNLFASESSVCSLVCKQPARINGQVHLPSAVRSNVVRQRSNLVALLSESMCFLRSRAFLKDLSSILDTLAERMVPKV